MAWLGKPPIRCELCQQTFDDRHFIDGRTKFGYWAIMCCKCHYYAGTGFGEGKGQKYDLFLGARLAGKFDRRIQWS